MKIISLSKKIGEKLGCRNNAAQFRDEIIKLNQPVQLDFSGVKVISYSFAIEFFGQLARHYGPEVFHTRVILKNLKPDGHAIVKTIISDIEKRAA